MLIDLLEKLESHTKPEPIDLVEEIKLEAKKKVHFGSTLDGKVKKEYVQW